MKLIWIEGFIYFALPWLTVAGGSDSPWTFKTQAAALTSGLIGLKAFLSTSFADSQTLSATLNAPEPQKTEPPPTVPVCPAPAAVQSTINKP